ncbi:hypothetical protein A2873_05695 [Candidatus Woesebacteria bacterium RIFCSPHIGHO2_01_FULL_42_80]|uniref:Uncharacterized protein n=1 Tax=Candidatus Woesebacteria bacterium RIFCSPHIGHO2_12_FULL_41_24 TaxID=1802510 RepID=A0A1F8AQQ6_9BACT|nr:MAG: hypothetical protein A2873_05695 [Candidatus Woesebacteria bacterium RIFCSPHIGHO2_01_FULL_42_80]OGM54103.1 MAG: hypothetical protein A3E44_02780 [Candidatus Woesebacteria bacterium RIFCSPHIGHO2_12_FULL_41_24]OGM68371.1 MAG: hypothetical protein A2969_01840 [Candidatus Woesebacteria bacterium RIFCSPLOWO2_01_FULL_42_67]
MLKLYQILSARGSEHKVARAENKRGRRPSFRIVRRLVRSAAATFEIRSNLFKNVHRVKLGFGCIAGSSG